MAIKHPLFKEFDRFKIVYKEVDHTNLDLTQFSEWKVKSLLNYNFTTILPYYF